MARFLVVGAKLNNKVLTVASIAYESLCLLDQYTNIPCKSVAVYDSNSLWVYRVDDPDEWNKGITVMLSQDEIGQVLRFTTMLLESGIPCGVDVRIDSDAEQMSFTKFSQRYLESSMAQLAMRIESHAHQTMT